MQIVLQFFRPRVVSRVLRIVRIPCKQNSSSEDSEEDSEPPKPSVLSAAETKVFEKAVNIIRRNGVDVLY